jgi:hypothetical protein
MIRVDLVHSFNGLMADDVIIEVNGFSLNFLTPPAIIEAKSKTL